MGSTMDSKEFDLYKDIRCRTNGENTETAYGQFPIWHPDAEIRMMDLENRTAMDQCCPKRFIGTMNMRLL